MRALALVCSSLFIAACSEPTGGGLGQNDASSGGLDATIVVDSGETSDAGNVDLGSPADTGAADTGPADSGVGMDAGSTDASTVDCMALSESECLPSTGCERVSCPGECGAENYIGCFGPNDPWPSCPPPQDCPCDRLDETSCAANSYRCHAVYFDPQTCACQGLGCCAQFQRCAAPQLAQCQPGIVVCDLVPPYCELPYVISYENDCYEGCVRQEVCSF